MLPAVLISRTAFTIRSKLRFYSLLRTKFFTDYALAELPHSIHNNKNKNFVKGLSKKKFMKLKLSRPKFLMCVLILGLVVLVRLAMSDMNLDVDLLRDSLMKMPGIVMENIQFAREVSGDMWRVKIPYLDRDGDTVNMRSLDIRREISNDKGEWYFFGREGVYSHDQKTASISGLLGTLDDSERVWNLESPKLDWQEKNNTFTFPEGLVIYDEEFLLRTPQASMDNSGVILLEQGGVIQWVKPIEEE